MRETKNKEARELVTELLKWILSLTIIHVLVGTVFWMILFERLADYVDDGRLDIVNTVIFIFGIMWQILFAAYYNFTMSREVDFKTPIKNALKEGTFDFWQYYRDNLLRVSIYKIALFGVYQLPVTITYPFLNIAFVVYTITGKIYIMDAGAYAVTNSALLGLIVNLLIFGGVFIVTQIFSLYLAQKEIRRNSIFIL